MFINMNFFLIWAGMLVSQLGDKFYAIALAWWVLEKSGSPSIMGLFMMASVLPGILMGLVAGVYVDRFNHKILIISADILRGIIVMAVAVLSFLGQAQIWHIFLAAIIISVASAFFNPTIPAMIPRIVKKENLASANANIQIVGGITTVLGPLAGAASVAVLGFSYVFLINAVSYLLSAASECFIKFSYSPQREEQRKIIKDIQAGFKFLISRKRVLSIIIIIGMTHFFVGAFTVSLPFAAKILLGEGVNNLGYLQAALGIGLLLGAIIKSTVKNSALKETRLFLIIVFMGCDFIVFGILLSFARLILPYLLITFVMGSLTVNASIYWQTMLQNNTHEDMRGRVFSISTLVGNTSIPLSYAFFGFLLEYMNVSTQFLISGIVLCAISSIFLIKYPNVISKIEGGI